MLSVTTLGAQEPCRADYADDEYIKELIQWVHPHLSATTTTFAYTEAENAAMLRLPRKECMKQLAFLFNYSLLHLIADIATPLQEKSLYLTLISILFSYAYDSRTTQHEPTSESAWTLASLTPAFSALDPPPYSAGPTSNNSLAGSTSSEMLASSMIASFRRSLAFPLYRSWALAERVRADTAALLGAGLRTIVRCLLEVKHILDHHDAYYIYSKIWIDDLLVWLMAYAKCDLNSPRSMKLLIGCT
jgi:protein SHQ1